MKLNDILLDDIALNEVEQKIARECSIFLEQSFGTPVFKLLKRTYDDYDKIKLRLRKNVTSYNESFSAAFNYQKLRQRALFTESSYQQPTKELDCFYIFPINEYQFLYNRQIKKSHIDHKPAFKSLLELNESSGIDVFTDMLKYTYENLDLMEGINSKSEIIFYNIPYFYGVRSSAIKYKHLFTRLTS